MAEKEWYTVSGDDLVDEFQELIYQKDIRKISLKCNGQQVDFPINQGQLESETEVQELPLLAVVEAIGDAVNECTIEIEKVEDKDEIETAEDVLQYPD